MTDEKWCLDCPHCGKVEGYAPAEREEEQETQPEESDSVIEEDVFETTSGPSPRVRCPRCGRWMSADRVGPA